MQQIVSRALISTEIVDILEAVGLEALCKLLNEEIRSHSRVNVVHTRVFSERLESAIARYQNNAVTTAQVIQELIGIAKEIRAARNRGEEQGQSQDEIAFYDALAERKRGSGDRGCTASHHCP